MDFDEDAMDSAVLRTHAQTLWATAYLVRLEVVLLGSTADGAVVLVSPSPSA
jgi:hypothetical protein